jgi:GH15 family glucan-1,4-alpha-glucosidase
MPYTPIQDYGLIGNMRTAALVSKTGSIDWLCLPKFDSPSVFGSILDERIGGAFSIRPTESEARNKQYYWPSTNILVTQFLHPSGIGELQDYMPVAPGAEFVDQVVRRVSAARGTLEFTVECRPAFNYARDGHSVTEESGAFIFRSANLSLALIANVSGLRIKDGAVVGKFTLKEGENALFVLRIFEEGDGVPSCPTHEEAEYRFRQTTQFWRAWLSKCTYQGRWREIVERSALALKLLTYQPTGAIIASPTTSLPESIGDSRNWDYRYVWVRDAAFTVYALLRIGFHEEAINFMQWVMKRLDDVEPNPNGPLRILYSIDGDWDVKEETLDHLEGYRGSRPVRIGNRAIDQLQLDIYGELMDSVYLFNKFASPVGSDQWTKLHALMEWLCENWERPDQSIWEMRSEPQQHVYSKFMCWVALDRALRLAQKRSLPVNFNRWSTTRDEIYNRIFEKGWSNERGSFVQSFSSDVLDASALLMPLVFFMAGNDPRMLSTLDAINRPISKGGLVANGLVFRYNSEIVDDGLPGTEGTFNMCSFWLVEALTRAGRLDPVRGEDARLLFEYMMGNANHVGLYSEQTGATGDMLGNFPQALTHLALISAAFNLDRLFNQTQ